MNSPSKRKTRVLVFPCGAENALEIYQSLRFSVHVELYGASSVNDHGRFRFKQYFGNVPNISSPEFESRFRALIEENGIDVVFATHDTVMEFLAPRARRMGFYLVNGNVETTGIARRKSETYRRFSDCAWVPAVYETADSVQTWPAIVKPDLGQGGQGVTLVNNAGEARLAMERVANPLLLEYLPGEEISVDCFTDRHRNLILVGPRTRERVRAGIAMRSAHMEADTVIQQIAAELNARLQFRGPWFFQLKRARDENWKLLEISCRVAGSMVAQRARGVNLPLLAILDYLDRDVAAQPDVRMKLVDRSLSTRLDLDFEFDTVYIDLDDTLVIDGHANPGLMAFLYQMLQEGKRLVLITRHEFSVAQTLSAARIAEELFDAVVHITDGRAKSDFVTPRSIFIDNHFPERLMVANKHAIPVLDVDAIELLTR